MNTRLVVFDIAGTTVADRGNINEAFRNAFLSIGIIVDAADVDAVMGYRKMEAIKIIINQYAPDFSEDERIIKDIHDVFENNMIEFYEEDKKLEPLPFALSVFQSLQERNIKVALNTGFTRAITDTILKRLGWIDNPLIDAVVCSDEVPEGRPYPFMIQHIMQQLLIENVEDVIKVGDTEVDIKEGRNAGCGLVIAVTTGAYLREQLTKLHPDYIINSLNELMPVIDQLKS